MPAAAPALDTAAGWRVLAGCGLVALFGVTALYGSTFGLFLRPLQQDLGWTRADIAFSLTLLSFIGPALVPLIGWVVDHVPLRPLVIAGVVLQSCSFAAFSLMGGSVWNYYVLCIVLVFTATGASMLTLAKVVQSWFDKALGRAMGILFACGAMGGVIFPPVVQAIITNVGWRQAFQAMGVASLVMGLIAALLAVRARGPARSDAAAVASAPAEPGVPVSMRAFLGDRIWWLLAQWNILFAFGIGFILLHFAAMLQDRGATPAQSAWALSMLGLGGLVGNLVAGWLMDCMSPSRLAVFLMLAPMAAALMLYAGGGVPAALLAGAVLGLCAGSDHSLSMLLARRYFSAETFGRASATQMVAAAVGGGVSPWLSGLMHDRNGNYDAALLIAAGSFGLAALAAWRLPAARPAGPAAVGAPSPMPAARTRA